MSLDALAPDQRAVVQLVLQQDRSYDDLAGLLGITPAAVRERAHRGLERLAPGEALSAGDRGTISDYLLGQQSVSEREATRGMLSGSQPARSWAHAVSAELASVARSPLPEIPGGETASSVPAETEATEPVLAGDDDPLLADPIAPTTRARPRPRQRAQDTAPAADFGFSEVTGSRAAPKPGTDTVTGKAADAPPSTSRLGGALLIAGLAILIAALVIFLVNRDDDPDPSTATTPTGETTPGPTGTTSPDDYQAAGFIRLRAQGDASGRGIVVFFSTQAGEVAINVEADRLEPAGESQAYGLWLTGGPENHFLGYADVAENGTLQASGPQEADAADFTQWISDATDVVISLENADPGTEPAQIVLSGKLSRLQAIQASPTATP